MLSFPEACTFPLFIMLTFSLLLSLSLSLSQTLTLSLFLSLYRTLFPRLILMPLSANAKLPRTLKQKALSLPHRFGSTQWSAFSWNLQKFKNAASPKLCLRALEWKLKAVILSLGLKAFFDLGTLNAQRVSTLWLSPKAFCKTLSLKRLFQKWRLLCAGGPGSSRLFVNQLHTFSEWIFRLWVTLPAIVGVFFMTSARAPKVPATNRTKWSEESSALAPRWWVSNPDANKGFF